jgi:hypothetical protein
MSKFSSKYKSVPKKKEREGTLVTFPTKKKKKGNPKTIPKKKRRERTLVMFPSKKKERKPMKKSTYPLTLQSRSKFKTVPKKKRERTLVTFPNQKKK